MTFVHSFTRLRRSGLGRWVSRLLPFRDSTDRALERVVGQPWGKETVRIVYSLLENPKTAETGRLLLATVAVRKNWRRTAREVFAQISDDTLLRYALPEAAKALAESEPERVKALLRSGRKRWRTVRPLLSSKRCLSLAITSAALGDAEGVECFAASIRNPALTPKAEILKRLFAAQQCTARKLGVSADYSSVSEAARVQTITSPTGARTRIGLLDYMCPVEPSANLGDWVQTLAAIGQLTRFAFGDLKAPEAVRDLLAQGNLREGESPLPVRRPVELLPVNRDFPLTSALEGMEEGPIWLPLSCWFGREAYPGRFDFPFPGNIRPLFMALHIARADVLNEESIAYLRLYEPIGCRDLFTARLLRGAGVKAFFNGCATMTLDRLRPPHAGERKGRYHSPRGGYPYQEGYIPSPHGDWTCLTRDFDGNLRAAMGLLDRYHTAEDVRTERLHCYLPCRAMGVPVTLTEKLHRGDPRLGGLSGLDDAAFRETAARFEAVAQPVLAAVLEGRSEAEVFALWREVTAPAMARTDAMIAERNAKFPLPEIRLENLGLDQVPVRDFGVIAQSGQTSDAVTAQPLPGALRPVARHARSRRADASCNPVHLLFAFDEKLAKHFPGGFEGIWRHATRPLVVHIFGRGLNAAMFEQWAAQFVVSGDAQKGVVSGDAQKRVAVRFIHYDLSGFTYGDGLRLKKGTTVSTMDRVLAPALLPDVEKVVWLDADILVRRDISRLFDIEPGDAPLAGCGDPREIKTHLAKNMYRAHRNRTVDEVETVHNAFFSGATIFNSANTGVMVMNLAQMRREGAVEKLLASIAVGGFHDGYATNLYARGRWKPLAREWNHAPFMELMGNPALVHFHGSLKPWSMNLPFGFWKEWREDAASASRQRRAKGDSRRLAGAGEART